MLGWIVLIQYHFVKKCSAEHMLKWVPQSYFNFFWFGDLDWSGILLKGVIKKKVNIL